LLDDFFTRALIAGIALAVVAAPVGCNIIWRRMSYFGDTLAHSSLLGVVIALSLNIHLMLSVFVVSASVALALMGFRRTASVSSDAILGLLAHATLALALVVISLLPATGIDMTTLLFGDILSVGRQDVKIILIAGCVLLAILAVIWRSLFAVTVSAELAEAEQLPAAAVQVVFLLIVAAMVALSIKLVGALLITALLIIPPAAARRFSHGPEQMAVLSMIVGALSVIGGLHLSLFADTPAGPSIVLFASVLFIVSTVGKLLAASGKQRKQ